MDNVIKKFIKEGYKYYPIWLAELYEAYAKYATVEVDDLISKVYHFDTTYSKSDSSSTYRAGKDREAELIKEIKASNYSFADKDYLIDGLNYGLGYERFKEHFPETVTFELTRHHEILRILDTGKYDEALIDSYLERIAEIEYIIKGVIPDVNKGDFIIWTKPCRELSREDLHNNGLIPLNIRRDLHRVVVELVEGINVEELKLISTIRSGISTYLNVGTKTSPNYQRVSPIKPLGFRWSKVSGKTAITFDLDYSLSVTLIL